MAQLYGAAACLPLLAGYVASLQQQHAGARHAACTELYVWCDMRMRSLLSLYYLFVSIVGWFFVCAASDHIQVMLVMCHACTRFWAGAPDQDIVLRG